MLNGTNMSKLGVKQQGRSQRTVVCFTGGGGGSVQICGGYCLPLTAQNSHAGCQTEPLNIFHSSYFYREHFIIFDRKKEETASKLRVPQLMTAVFINFNMQKKIKNQQQCSGLEQKQELICFFFLPLNDYNTISRQMSPCQEPSLQ